MAGKIGTHNAKSNSLVSWHSSNTHKHSIQKPRPEKLEQMVKQEAAETRDADQLSNIDHSLEDCRGSQENFIVSIKNEPIEDDEYEMEYSNGDINHSIISVKGEALDIECEEQQINETKVKTQRRRYECPYCPRGFTSKANVSHHKAAIHEGLEHEVCNICGKSVRRRYIKKHKLTHSDEKPHKCDFCGKCFAVKTLLRAHIHQHTGEKPYKCKYCERAFRKHTHYKEHMSRHIGVNIYRCELCPLAFPTAKELRLHFTVHKNEDSDTRERNMKALREAEAELQLKLSKKDEVPNCENKRYECPYCPRRFHDSANLSHHKATHEGVKREACDICGKSISKRHLKRHKVTHDDKKAHKCDFCEKCFGQTSYLRDHMRQHTGEKPYKCNYCERAFATAKQRHKHLRFHFGVNIFRCELCPAAFPAGKELRVHFATHKNEDAATRERNMKALQEVEAELQLKFSKREKSHPARRRKNNL